MNKFDNGLIGKSIYPKKVSGKDVLDDTLTIVGQPTIMTTVTTPSYMALNTPCVTKEGEIVIRDISHWYIV